MTLAVKRCSNLDALSLEAAGVICDQAAACVRARDVFTLALSGGNTPRRLYDYLARPRFSRRMPWNKTHIFWGDERCVPPGDARSNFCMAQDTLISKVSIPSQNIHRIPAEIEPPQEAARAYEKILLTFFQSLLRQGSRPPLAQQTHPRPVFDLILLGVGNDGHTASLFPGDDALEEKKHLVAAVLAPKGSPPTQRITLTLPLINNANCVMFLVSGAGKQQVVHEIMANQQAAGALYPAARVRPSGDLLWFIDEQSQ